MNDIKISSNRSFGVVFSIFFALVALYIFYKSENTNYVLILLSLFFLTLGLINSIILTPLNILWFKFGILLSKIVSPIIMGLIFFGVVTPLALLAKLVGKDFLELNKKKNKKRSSYWIKKEKYNHTMKDQF
jgi:polyferredoxin